MRSLTLTGTVALGVLVVAASTVVFADPPRTGRGAPGAGLSAKEQLGKLLFFDERLSARGNQDCSDCHGLEVGWTGPIEAIDMHGAVYEGSVAGRFGARKPPSSAYASFSPILHRDKKNGEFVGGAFWDGRATGEKLGNPAADQAQGPFLNPLEQALPDAAAVVKRVCSPHSGYSLLLRQVWGQGICDDVDAAFAAIARSIERYEASREMSAFSSRFDAYLAGEAALDDQELRGLALFRGKAGCDTCHAIVSDGNVPPLFTDFTYANLGAPKNPENPFYTQPPAVNPLGAAFVDLGLGSFLATRPEYASLAAENNGKHKVPTLRNVDKRPYGSFVKAYGHNGYFKSLEEMVHFYNTRAVLPTCAPGDPGEKRTCWPAPEVADNLETAKVGNLGLTTAEERDIVAFLGTLSDR
ncbi:cytochrome-c peroxidase [Nannocystis bainbridge]|uniref:Cytochrome c peroxidase n=1 Tax=Nannocystis bainbridge TaxID=2995303 RepID=A0ABT5E579_9BACT|nr:cytochrome c peroxidase [Nannocystis bainbridge]MDC0720870.1 cytochrome c peroxidase [Nannocystis bainbridge]